jgi:succinate dehydrogenase/fumarate reductase flavoprotein subunit
MDAAESAFDVVVVGSGAAGLTAALAATVGGARVVVLEKSALLGGTTAMSGGVLWTPNNQLMADAGEADTRDAALRYLQRLTLGRVDTGRLEIYLDECNQTLRFLDEHAGIQFDRHLLPDYQPELPGGSVAGRGVVGRPYDLSRLDAYALQLRWAPRTRRLDLDTHVDDIRRPDDPVAVNGQALVGHLVEACVGHGVVIRTEVRVTELVRERGCIGGVVAASNAGEQTLLAAMGVVLATGGFEWNPAFRDSFLAVPLELPLGSPTNVGDGVRLLMSAGAALDNMTEAWWSPAFHVSGEQFEGSPMNRTISWGRSKPGQILVNRRGRRFVAEGINYNDITRAMMNFDPGAFEYPNLPCWFICDASHLRAYPLLVTMDADSPPPPWLVGAPTLQELAIKTGIDPDGLAAQVSEFNGHAAMGVDPVFHRGESVYDRQRGDVDAPHPNLRQLGPGPYYAVEMRIGALGTKGGARTDAHARVLDFAGTPIRGLYAAGNVAASVFGPSYPGPGATLGPATTFGRLAAESLLADHTRPESSVGGATS